MGYRYVWQGGGEGATVTLVEDPDYDLTGNLLPKEPASAAPAQPATPGITTPQLPSIDTSLPALSIPTDMPNVQSLLGMELTPSVQGLGSTASVKGPDTSAFSEIAKSIQTQTQDALAQIQNLVSAASVQAPTVLAPTTMPTLGDQATRDATRSSIADMLSRSGRASTILTQTRPGG